MIEFTLRYIWRSLMVENDSSVEYLINIAKKWSNYIAAIANSQCKTIKSYAKKSYYLN